MSNIISSDLTVFGIFQGEFGTNEKIQKSAFQDEFLGKNKNVRPLTTFKICCTEFTPSEKISLNFEIWTRVLKHPVNTTSLVLSQILKKVFSLKFFKLKHYQRLAVGISTYFQAPGSHPW